MISNANPTNLNICTYLVYINTTVAELWFCNVFHTGCYLCHEPSTNFRHCSGNPNFYKTKIFN